MINKFAATCNDCGSTVAVGAGQTNLHEGKWITKHTACPPKQQRRAGVYIGGGVADFYCFGGDVTYADHLIEQGMSDADFKDMVRPDGCD